MRIICNNSIGGVLFRHRHRKRNQHGRKRCGSNCAELYLSELAPGQRARIVRVGGHGHARRRFMEMGLVSGETILVQRVAPLGDPIEFFVKGYHVSLRRHDARNIEVRSLGDDHEGGPRST